MSPEHDDGTDSRIASYLMRDEWIKKQLDKRINEFTDEKTLHIFCGTWNVNAKKGDCRLEAWLKPESMKRLPDIYAIGLQEIVDLNASNVMRDPQTAEPWINKFQACLSDDYALVNYKQLVGIVLCLFAKRDIYPQHLTKVLMASTGVGVLGIGNKGAIAIRFNLYDSTVCILNSHLAAHQNNVQARNDNFRDISDKVRFVPPTEKGIRAGFVALDQHDYVFWIGDLNYRIDLPDIDVIFDRIIAEDFEYLLCYDQLLQERKQKAVFNHYNEGNITFPPTYKFQPNTNEYERRPEKKKRSPAWCDRILWKARSGTVNQLFYESAPALCISDHKPVMSMFQIAVKILVKEKQNEICQALIRQLDALENQQIPKIALSTSSIQFAGVRFEQTVRQLLTIRNDGEAIVQFQFASRPHSDGTHALSQPWISISPNFGIIPPGEEVDVEISLCVKDREIAFSLNAGRATLDDILIIKLFKGCDYFITVAGDWVPSCLASSVEYLISVPGPVRISKPSDDHVLAVPKEIWRIVDFLFRNGGLEFPELFTTPGHSSEVLSIIEDLDENVAWRSSFSLVSAATALLRIMTSLCRPIVPVQLIKTIRSHPDPIGLCKQVLLEIPLSHYNIIIHLMSFLREIVSKRGNDETQTKNIAMVFGQAFCQYPSQDDSRSITDTMTLLSSSPATLFVEYLLTEPAFV